MKTIIMAGGKGTRIQSIASDIPKPMIPIDGVPVLERVIFSLKSQGFTDIIITVSHCGSVIMNYFGYGEKYGVTIEYFNEEVQLGNAGALFKLRSKLGEEPFLLLNADAIFDVDFNTMVVFHKSKNALVTLFTHPNSHPYDSGLLIAEKDLSVRAWLTKEDERPVYYKNRVNAGLHVIDPAVLDLTNIDPEKIGTVDEITGKVIKVDLDRQLLKPLAGTGTMFCYDSSEYVRDMGTPERFHSVESDFKTGRVSSKNLKNKQKAVFLDRDGTINKYVGFLKNKEELELIDGVAGAIKKINRSGYLCIVVTNQSVISRGEVTYGELEEINNKMETLLGLQGAYIDGLYYCPHHPHKGYDGEVVELKIDCGCRKPKPGMLVKAAEDFNIDMGGSFMVGDSENDVKTGVSAGCKSVLIGKGTEENFGQMDTVASVAEFVEKYLSTSNKNVTK
ncbi:HAD-IIIA family hydrolase [Anaerosporobacter sp.]|uniref:HAD-IIIA family hydrolase n=1 Tax=Anaerosporobacter sp. TaxID=1872529 RepID=UPI00286F8F9A|nr:HAD-IIIA family hydrolase [Anaerosporobacter sp.]